MTEGEYNANVKVENIGDTIIENWHLSLQTENGIANIWKAEIDGFVGYSSRVLGNLIQK